jgi:flavin-dependent dehydrogenase
VVTSEVAVVGAGPAGCAAAATVARGGGSVVLIDPALAKTRAPRIGEGAAPGTPQLIDEIFGRGTRAFEERHHLMCPSTVYAWGGREPAVTDHLYNPLGPAWTLDRERFDHGLQDGAAGVGVECHAAVVHALDQDRRTWRVHTRSDTDGTVAVHARIVVDATGRSARVARRCGTRQRHLDRLVALWSVWSVEAADERSSIHVEAVESGWWYSALLPGRRRVVAYLTDADLLPTGGGDRIDLARSARELPLIGTLLSIQSSMVDGPRVAIARSSRLDVCAGPTWLATGDAALTVDPLSGRGVVSALLTGRAAGQAATASVRSSSGAIEVSDYVSLLDDLFVDARTRQLDAYQGETRWPTAPFWGRRSHSSSMPLAAMQRWTAAR